MCTITHLKEQRKFSYLKIQQRFTLHLQCTEYIFQEMLPAVNYWGSADLQQLSHSWDPN